MCQHDADIMLTAYNVTEITNIHKKELSIVLKLQVAPEDMGKVIGKHGRIAKAIRSVVKSASQSSVKKYVLEIVE